MNVNVKLLSTIQSSVEWVFLTGKEKKQKLGIHMLKYTFACIFFNCVGVTETDLMFGAGPVLEHPAPS